MTELVGLRITDGDAPDRSVLMSAMPRDRAEAIVWRMLELWGTRYLCSIEPLTEERTVGWLAFLTLIETSLGFIKGHFALISTVGLALLLGVLGILAVYLPASHYRVTPVVMLGLVAFFSGFFGAKKLDQP